MPTRVPPWPPESSGDSPADGISQPIAASGEWVFDAPDAVAEERYTRGAVLGQGGMGTVYLAEDPRLRRQVALKEARGHPDGPAASRLRREARITASLDHPSIVPVFDTGHDDQGRPWYTMRVVRGRSLAAVMAETSDLRSRLRLLRPFLSACEAVAYAHHRGIVHRDLKPDNILLGPFGETQVMDWGLARPVGPEAADWDAVLSGVQATAVGMVLGTPAYMSPEQAVGDHVGLRSDVWSLGVCLFELLTGTRPFQGDSAQRVLAQVVGAPLPAPSARESDLPAELGAIITRATARDPDARYPTAGALAQDLEAWLDGRRVSAHRYSAADELGRAFSRFRRVAGVVGVIGGVALLAVVVAWQGTLAQRDRAVAAQAALLKSQQRSAAHLAQALIAQARAASRAGARGEAETLAGHALMLGESPEARGLLMDASPRPRLSVDVVVPTCVETRLSPDGGAVACRRAGSLALFDAETMRERWRTDATLGAVAFTGAGHPYGAGPTDAMIRVFDRDTGGLVPGAEARRLSIDRRIGGSHPSRIGSFSSGLASFLDVETGERLQVKSDGRIVEAWADADGTLFTVEEDALVWRRWDGSVIRRDVLISAFASVVSTNARRVALGYLDGRVEIRERGDGTLVSVVQLPAGMLHRVALAEDGRWVAAIDEGGSAWVWPVADPEGRLRVPGKAVDIGFPNDGELQVLGARLRRWVLPAPGLGGRLRATGGVSNLDWRGEVLGASLGNGVVRMWRLADGVTHDVQVRQLDQGAAKDVGIAGDGHRFAAVALAADTHLGAFGAPGRSVTWSARGCRRVVWLDPDLLVCTPQTDGPAVMRTDGTEFPGLRRAGATLIDAEPDGSRRRAVLASSTGEVMLLESGDVPSLQTLFSLREVSGVAISGDGLRVVTVLTRGVQLRDRDGTVRWSRPTETRLRDVALSHDDRLVVGGGRDGLARVWRASDGQPLAVLDGHVERVQAVVFSPDDQRLATGSWDETVRLWDLSALDRPAAALLADVERAWGLSLEDALGRELRR